VDQRVEEIEAERDGHDKSDDRFAHGAPSSELPQSHRVEAHQRDDRKSENYESQIEHNRLLARRLPSAGLRKLSIWI
jgi:hypothetical protein